MDLGRLVEAGEMQAWIDVVRAAPAPIASGLGLEMHEMAGGLAVVARRLDSAEINRVIGVGLARPVVLEDLHAVADLYRSLALTKAGFHPSPKAEPAKSLDGWLSEVGFTRATAGGVKLARNTAPMPAATTDLTIVQAERAQAGLFGSTVATAYGFPPVVGAWVTALVGRPDWRCYIAYDGERPVAAGALHLGETHGWLGFAATRTYARNRGAHSGLIVQRVAAAAAAGKAWVVGEATTTPEAQNPGHDNGLRGGFQVVHRRAAYVI